jgi:hypothetical protein
MDQGWMRCESILDYRSNSLCSSGDEESALTLVIRSFLAVLLDINRHILSPARAQEMWMKGRPMDTDKDRRVEEAVYGFAHS